MRIIPNSQTWPACVNATQRDDLKQQVEAIAQPPLVAGKLNALLIHAEFKGISNGGVRSAPQAKWDCAGTIRQFQAADLAQFIGIARRQWPDRIDRGRSREMPFAQFDLAWIWP